MRAGAGALVLACSPGKSGGALTFAYTLTNTGAVDAFAMTALPVLPARAKPAQVRDHDPSVLLGAQGDAVVGVFAAPLPPDRLTAVPALPLARRLAPGKTLEGRVEVRLPLAECSPYFADLPLRRYEVVPIAAVVFAIGWWAADADGLVAAPARYAPELWVVETLDTLAAARRAEQRFPVNGLTLFKRDDAFPRDLPAA